MVEKANRRPAAGPLLYSESRRREPPLRTVCVRRGWFAAGRWLTRRQPDANNRGPLRGIAMASRTAASTVKRKNKHEKAGRRRKNRLARKSTQSMTELFAALGEP